MQTKERKQVESLTRIYTVIVFVMIGVLIAKLAWMQLVETDFLHLKGRRTAEPPDDHFRHTGRYYHQRRNGPSDRPP